jgi:hypothetical protein
MFLKESEFSHQLEFLVDQNFSLVAFFGFRDTESFLDILSQVIN